jgi:rubrerythrin
LIEAARKVRTDFVTSEQKPETGPLPERTTDRSESAGEYWRWCPRCGHELHNEKCKLRCPHCHYFMSCSDFD